MEDIFIDHIWNLFENLEDSDNQNLANSCFIIASYFDFDVEVLPTKLHKNVVNLIKKAKQDIHAEDYADKMYECEDMT